MGSNETNFEGAFCFPVFCLFSGLVIQENELF